MEEKCFGVTVVVCGDGRHWDGTGLAHIAEGARVLADGFGTKGMRREDGTPYYDLLAVPGPAHVLSDWSNFTTVEVDGRLFHKEGAIIARQAELYQDIHEGELVILCTHWDCGREGSNGKNKKILLKNLQSGIRNLGRYFSEILDIRRTTFACMLLHLNEKGQIDGVNTFTVTELAETLSVL